MATCDNYHFRYRKMAQSLNRNYSAKRLGVVLRQLERTLLDPVPGFEIPAHLLDLGRLRGDDRLGQGLDLGVLRLL